ncbi:hypothetical protein L873DRAFT_1709088 [Choiromyces venosus 120613-1]|uniref:Cell wall mannoprotein PIR1-like C-terminal domain-containing protein n=1 Tax=Choiromyces venosus 120613-1 TaxID=1336337 RepID=A0A3N4J835_9PEZI|nr:hypothetical protein L873DRAFT_1709088 [Choiromyces venosus 120613-1]
MPSLHFTPLLLLIPLLLLPKARCIPQGVTAIIKPSGSSPPGCVDTYPGPFGFQPVDHPSPTTETQCIQPTSLKMLLNKGLLVDHLGRIGSIVANRQFQFDGPPAQAGAIYTGGWSLCSDGLIALGPSKQFFACKSSDFENIYDSMIADYCRPIFLEMVLFVEC